MKIGDQKTWQRTFSEDDITLFNKMSGDQGVHHVTPDAKGRLMVHGLLTATIPTKIGGDMNFIAREMKFQFRHHRRRFFPVQLNAFQIEFLHRVEYLIGRGVHENVDRRGKRWNLRDPARRVRHRHEARLPFRAAGTATPARA